MPWTAGFRRAFSSMTAQERPFSPVFLLLVADSYFPFFHPSLYQSFRFVLAAVIHENDFVNITVLLHDTLYPRYQFGERLVFVVQWNDY